MGGRILRRNVYTAFQCCLTGQTVRRLDPVRGIRVQGDVFPGEETV